MIRKGQWGSAADVRHQNHFIDQLFELMARGLFPPVPPGCLPSSFSKLQHFPSPCVRARTVGLSLSPPCAPAARFCSARGYDARGDAAGTRNAHPIVRSDRPPIAMRILENI